MSRSSLRCLWHEVVLQGSVNFRAKRTSCGRNNYRELFPLLTFTTFLGFVIALLLLPWISLPAAPQGVFPASGSLNLKWFTFKENENEKFLSSFLSTRNSAPAQQIGNIMDHLERLVTLTLLLWFRNLSLRDLTQNFLRQISAVWGWKRVNESERKCWGLEKEGRRGWKWNRAITITLESHNRNREDDKK